LLKKNKLYYQPTIGDDLVPVSLTAMMGSDRFSLNIGETMTSHMFDYNPQGKDFLLIKRPNEMLLLINDKNSMVLDSISFVKPTAFLTNKDLSEIFFAHLICGNYKLESSGEDVWFDLGGNMKGINGFSKWNVTKASGKITPVINSTHTFVVLKTSNLKQRESFLVVFDELIKTMNFFKYTVLNDGTYNLDKNPQYKLKKK